LGALKWGGRGDDKLLVGGVGRSFQRDVERQLFAGTHDAEPRRAANGLGREAIVEGIGVLDWLPIDRHDEVAGLEPSTRRWARRCDARDQRAGGALEPEGLRRFGGCGLVPPPRATDAGRWSRRSWPKRPRPSPCWRGSRNRSPASRLSARRWRY